MENNTSNRIDTMVTKETVLRDIRKNNYTRALFQYGVVPLTLLLEEYEKDNNFEECQIIYEVILNVNKHFFQETEEVLPTKYSKAAVKNWKKEFNKYGFTGEIAESNIPFYIEEIREMVG